MTPRLSIISVNYNGLALTCAMIDSLRRYITTPIEIIVVDNGSREDEAAKLQECYTDIVAIRSEKNLGFAGGNNLGIKEAKGKYILLLNNDTEVEDDTLHYLCESLDRRADVGAISPKIRFFTAPRNIQFAGYTPLTAITLRNSLIGFNAPDEGSFNSPHHTPYAHGAAMMFRREVLDKVGAMPEIYFLYYEELDWSTRITDAGYKIAYDPRCTVFHKESATTGQQSALRTFYITRNRLLFGWRNRRGAARYATIIYQTFIAAPKNIVVELVHGNGTLAWAIVRGVWKFFGLEDKTA